MIIYIIQLIFTVYSMMIFARIILSWFPKTAHHKVTGFIAFYTDPYLNLFRRFIPPIGGVLDLSPILALFVLQLAENLLFKVLL